MAQLEPCPMHQKVAGLIPLSTDLGCGFALIRVHTGKPIDAFHINILLSPFLSRTSIGMSLGWEINNSDLGWSKKKLYPGIKDASG